MSKVAAAQDAPYLSHLLKDLAERGHVTGHLALNRGKRDLFDGRSIDIRPESRLLLARVPVNPCKGGVPEPGVAAFCDKSPVFELPLAYPSHMNLSTLHLDRGGQITLDGKLGSEGVRLIGFKHQAANLAPQLEQIDGLFQGICAQVTAHPLLLLGNLVELESSGLTLELEGGAQVDFDAKGRLPAGSLRAGKTKITLGKAPSNSRYCMEMKITHECELLESAESEAGRKIRIELSALVGAPAFLAPKAQAEGQQGAPAAADKPAVDAAQAAASQGAAGKPAGALPGQADRPAEGNPGASYCAALYKGLMDALPASGQLSLSEQRWAKLADFMPKLVEVVGDCRIQCAQGTRLDFERTGNTLKVRPQGTLQVTLPEQHIPVKWGWLRRLLASVLVYSVQEVTAKVPTHGTDGPLTTQVQGTLGLRLGRWTLGAYGYSKEFNKPVPRDASLFEQLDRTAAQIARIYTFSPLVNVSHLVDLSRSQLQVTTARSGHTQLSEGLTLSACSTEVYMGAIDAGSRIAIQHRARVEGSDHERALLLQAGISFLDWPDAPVPVYADKHPPEVPASISMSFDDSGMKLSLQLGSRISTGIVRGIAGGAGRGLRALASRMSLTTGQGRLL